MAKYEYDKRKFSEYSTALIDDMIKVNVDKEILDLVTQINKMGKPVFKTQE